MTGVDRPVKQGQPTVSPAGIVAGCRKQIGADGRTPVPQILARHRRARLAAS